MERFFIQANAPENMSTRSKPTAMRTRFVKVDFDLLDESVSVGNDTGSQIALSLNLFGDTVYQATLDSLEQNAPEGFAWDWSHRWRGIQPGHAGG